MFLPLVVSKFKMLVENNNVISCHLCGCCDYRSGNCIFGTEDRLVNCPTTPCTAAIHEFVTGGRTATRYGTAKDRAGMILQCTRWNRCPNARKRQR
jgi:hypothetical protein